MATKRSTDVLVRDVEREVATKFRDANTTQSFNGTLRVKLDGVYVNKREGQRALENLRQLKLASKKGI